MSYRVNRYLSELEHEWEECDQQLGSPDDTLLRGKIAGVRQAVILLEEEKEDVVSVSREYMEFACLALAQMKDSMQLILPNGNYITVGALQRAFGGAMA